MQQTDTSVYRSLLCIGVDEYRSATSLEFCVSDATTMSVTLSMQEFGFDERKSLLNDQATRLVTQNAIIALMKEPANFKLLYFAGHGAATDDDGFLLTPDGTETNPGISLKWLRNQIVGASGTVMVILDCCRAGLASVRDGEFSALRAADIDRFIPELMQSRFLLAATTSDGIAEESRELRQGIFTFHLVEGLLGEAANREGVITPLGLFDYVAGKFEESEKQVPVFKGEQRGRVILGEGFSGPFLPDSEGDPTDLLDSLDAEARGHLDGYIKQVAVPLDEWQSKGYKSASQLLRPILRWFDRTAREYPDVSLRDTFSRARAEAESRLAQLGTLSRGTVTDYGKVIDYLGAGAFGTVWRVDPGDGRPDVALKLYHPHELHVKEKRVRFHRGYTAMDLLDHPHIVKVALYSESPVGFYMDYIDGPNLREFGNTVDQPAEILALLIVIAETLQHAHGRNVIHRDVKPENVLVTYDTENSRWNPYLTDFDLAWYSTATQVTREAFGAIFYAAPEQLAKPGSAEAHAKTTDVFAFGQLAFFLATGSDPVPMDVADNVRALSIRLGSWGNLEAAEQFRTLYESCTEKSPRDRLQDFRTISEYLYRIHRSLTERTPDQPVTSDRFVPELAFALAGLAQEQSDSHVITSRSGRTNIELTEPKVEEGLARVNITLVHGALQIPGANNERARNILNARIDRNIGEFPMARRRSGDAGTYRVFIEITDVEMNLRGVELCRQVIGRTVDSIESL